MRYVFLIKIIVQTKICQYLVKFTNVSFAFHKKKPKYTIDTRFCKCMIIIVCIYNNMQNIYKYILP